MENDFLIVISAAIIILIVMLLGVVLIVTSYQKRKAKLLENRLQLQIKLQVKELQRLSELEKQRQRIYSDLHDNIGSSLAAAKLETSLLKKQSQHPGLRGELLNLENIINDSYDGLKEVVWFMNTKNDTLSNFSEYIKDFIYRFFGSSQINIKFWSALNNDDRFLSALQRRDLLYIIKEASHNVLKHSDASLFSVELNTDAENIYVHLKDNGQGIKKDKKSINCNGLDTIRNRINANQGVFQFDSIDGFEIRFYMPLEIDTE